MKRVNDMSLYNQNLVFKITFVRKISITKKLYLIIDVDKIKKASYNRRQHDYQKHERKKAYC